MRLNYLLDKNQMSPLFLVYNDEFPAKVYCMFFTNKQSNPNDSLIKLNVES